MRFNPTMVRLRLVSVLSYLLSQLQSFNPTMVRLRLIGAKRQPQPKALFQSHYGAIATLIHEALDEIDRSFNPTMVRLRRQTSSRMR